MTRRGLGDRWLAGERVSGVAFAHNERVAFVGGRHDGEEGTIALLMAVDPEPLYLVTLPRGGEVRVRQSSLRAL